MALENVMRVDNGNIVDGKMPETYPAEQVMMSDGETSVEDVINDLILHKNVQGTTSSGGSISLGISANDYIVISVIDNEWNKPVPFEYGAIWYVNLYDTSGSTMTAKVNTTCNLSVYYMKKP